MQDSIKFKTQCDVCKDHSFEWAIKPPLWKSNRCWNHLKSHEKKEWKESLLSFLSSYKSLRKPQYDFELFKETYMKGKRSKFILKQHGYDKYLLEHLEVSSFSQLRGRFEHRSKNLNSPKSYKNKKSNDIISILYEDWLESLQANPQYISLQGVDLSDSDFSNCKLDFVAFDSADLSNINLSNSILSNSIFNLAKLSNANLNGADISFCSFEEANLTGTNLFNAHGENVQFKKTMFSNCNAQSSKLIKADFRGAVLNKVDFTSARLNYSDLSGLKIHNCFFQGAQILWANFTNTKFVKTQFNNVNCSNAKFINTDLLNTDLNSSNFSNSDFTGSNLESSILCNSDLEGAILINTNLRWADLRNTNLSNVEIYRAALKSTKVYFEDIKSSKVLTNQLKDGSLMVERAIKVMVFISYSHADSIFANKLENALRTKSIDVWIDSQEILPGDSLIEKIRAGIDNSQYVCALISSNSINSSWVQNELDIAMNQQIENKKVKVLPLVLEENLTLPSFLVGKLYVDFSNSEFFENGISQIMRRLNAHIY